MSQIWIGPLLLAALCLLWLVVQRAWVACMGEPADTDALQRPGGCGGGCGCGKPCPRKREALLAAQTAQAAPAAPAAQPSQQTAQATVG